VPLAPPGVSGGFTGMIKVPGTSGSYLEAAAAVLGKSVVSHPAVMIYGPTP
jgi:hypothetical protein